MRHINHKTSMTYKSVFFLCCRWTSEDGNLIAIKLHASETCFHDLEYTCPSNKSLILKLKAINIMFNQLNMKKTLRHLGPERQRHVLPSMLWKNVAASAISWKPPAHTGFEGHVSTAQMALACNLCGWTVVKHHSVSYSLQEKKRGVA